MVGDIRQRSCGKNSAVGSWKNNRHGHEGAERNRPATPTKKGHYLHHHPSPPRAGTIMLRITSTPKNVQCVQLLTDFCGRRIRRRSSYLARRREHCPRSIKTPKSRISPGPASAASRSSVPSWESGTPALRPSNREGPKHPVDEHHGDHRAGGSRKLHWIRKLAVPQIGRRLKHAECYLESERGEAAHVAGLRRERVVGSRQAFDRPLANRVGVTPLFPVGGIFPGFLTAILRFAHAGSNCSPLICFLPLLPRNRGTVRVLAPVGAPTAPSCNCCSVSTTGAGAGRATIPG